jgi:arylsulfatase
VTGTKSLNPGKHTVTLDFKYAGGGQGKGGTATLSVDGAKVGETRFDISIPLRISLDETLDCGEDTGTPVFNFLYMQRRGGLNSAGQQFTPIG